MTKEQQIAFENLQRVVMDHVQIAAKIDSAIQIIKSEINNEEPDLII